jgi:Xaa-Pro aminopeptidase
MISTSLKQTISRVLQPYPPTLTRSMSAGTAVSRTDTTFRLAELRKLMAAHNVEVYSKFCNETVHLNHGTIIVLDVICYLEANMIVQLFRLKMRIRANILLLSMAVGLLSLVRSNLIATGPSLTNVGFTGSAGCALVTPSKASLSTDGRYFLQAEQELDSNWELLKQGLPDVPTWQEW